MKDKIPGEVHLTKGADIKAPDGPQTEGMIRMPAIVGLSDQICGTGQCKHDGFICCELLWLIHFIVMVAKPHTASAVHHHGEEGNAQNF
jgi:hypothetical protein